MSSCFRYTECLVIGAFCLNTYIQAELITDQKPPNMTNYSVVNENLVNEEEIAVFYAQEHYRRGVEALNAQNWKESAKQFNILVLNYPHTTYAQEAGFFLGVSFYYLYEYDFANTAFTTYLKCQSNPRYFLETIEYKYGIAEKFRCGARRRCFGTKRLPKWASGTDIALEIYDEVAIAMPHHEIAARALFSKACLLWKQQQYRESLDTFRLVIKRFPKHELTPESYLLINQVYLEQSRTELQNPDILDFAQINMRKFQADFPNDERVSQAEANVLHIKEVYARGLFNTGDFYQRIRKPQAAVIYYRKAMVEFPETHTADWCRRRLYNLCPEALNEPLPSRNVESFNIPAINEDLDQIDFSLD
jgi:outer membrane protein assembly factor BamD (BamD/ComL family)